MAILCIHNPVMHKDPQTYYHVEVGFTKLHTCPQAAHHQTVEALAGHNPFSLLNMGAGWQHYRPSRVGPVLRLPVAKGNRKVTVLVWLESPSQAETVTQTQQIFNPSELAKIQELLLDSPVQTEEASALRAKVAQLLKEFKA